MYELGCNYCPLSILHNDQLLLLTTATKTRLQCGHLGNQKGIGHFQVVQVGFQSRHIPTPTINPRVEDPNVPVSIKLLTVELEQQVVQEKTHSLMIVVQVLNLFSLLENGGFNAIPLSRVVKFRSWLQSVQRLTLIVSLSRRAHTQSVIAAEYLIAQVDASKARSLGLGSTTP